MRLRSLATGNESLHPLSGWRRVMQTVIRNAWTSPLISIPTQGRIVERVYFIFYYLIYSRG